MKIYLVGGAVRDELLNREIKDRDYVVVGSTPQEMLDLGFNQVGAEFPVFIHPGTGEEHALARTEYKEGHGYKGFKCNFSPDVTLEEDLGRRDITINAMARDASGNIIDPFNGIKDLENKTIRHISDSFKDDPLRVLRVARFAAQFKFNIADETLYLMRDIAASGELKYLTQERVFAELNKALSNDTLSIFFDVLNMGGALGILFPEIFDLIGVPQSVIHHPEGDVYSHTMKTLDYIKGENKLKFAMLMHDIGKALTPQEVLPRHIEHEINGLGPIKIFCDRLKVPSKYEKLALKFCKYHMKCHKFRQMRAGSIYKLLKSIGAFNDEKNLEDFILCLKADDASKKDMSTSYNDLKNCLYAAKKVNAESIKHKYSEKAFLQKYTQECILAIKQTLLVLNFKQNK